MIMQKEIQLNNSINTHLKLNNDKRFHVYTGKLTDLTAVLPIWVDLQIGLEYTESVFVFDTSGSYWRDWYIF